MGLRSRHSSEFQAALVEKILSRGDRSIAAVCEEAGIKKQTALNWVRKYGSVGAKPKPGGRVKWTGEAKFKAVVDTASLAEHDLGTYLRKEGLYSNQVTKWRADIIEHLGAKSKFAKDERDDIIRSLGKEILRKDKALAEASALLILQKKVNLIWGNKDEDEK